MSITLEQMQKAILNNAARDIEDREVIIGMVRSGQPFPALLSSWLVGGQTQQGKSCIAAFFVMWFLMAGSQIVLLDPHLHNKKRGLYTKLEPLQAWFARPPIDCLDIDEILNVIDWLEAEYKERKRSMSGKAPLLLIIDEFNELLSSGFTKKQAERIATVIGNVARGGSKHGMFVLAIGHNFDLASAGGNAVRRNIIGRVSVNAEVGEMCNILDTTDRTKIKQLATSPTPLRPGQAIAKVPGYGLYRLYYPMITAEYLAAFAIFLRKNTALETHSDVILAQIGTFTHSEYEDTPTPLYKPSPHEKTFGSTPPNVVPNVPPNIRITEDERRVIIQEGNKQLLETGKVVRTKIKSALGWNSDGYEKIKVVCDELGWHKDMTVQKLSTSEKQAMKEQAGKCAKCGSTENLEIDHVWPRSLGGPTTPDNLQVLCKECNQKKGATV